MTFIKKIWIVVILLVIAGLSAFLIIISNSSTYQAITISSLIDNHEQQLSNYFQGAGNELEILKPYLDKKLTIADTAELVKIKDQLLKLRVPVGYQDFHLSLVIKLSQLEDLLNSKNLVADTSVASLQKDLTALVEEFTKLQEQAKLPAVGVSKYN
ncbi:MAG: hypothetical protein WC575_02360 [Patescibacteria group bacterium]